MIKRYNQFVNESNQVPGPGTEGSVRISLSDEESDIFASESSLGKLISDNKVSLLAPELWYMEEDTETINILKNYFDIETDDEDYDENTGRGYDLNGEEPGFDEENESVRSIDESVDAKGKEDLEKLGKRIKDLQAEYDKKAKELGVKVESYKDKMKRKVAEAKEKHDKKK